MALFNRKQEQHINQQQYANQPGSEQSGFRAAQAQDGSRSKTRTGGHHHRSARAEAKHTVYIPYGTGSAPKNPYGPVKDDSKQTSVFGSVNWPNESAAEAQAAAAQDEARQHTAAAVPAAAHIGAAAATAAPAAAAVAAPTALPPLPTTAEIRAELDHQQYRKRFGATFRSTVFILIVVAAAAVLVAVLFLPVLQIYGSSMSGTLDSGDVVVSVKSSDLDTGDIVAFYYNNNILVKRVIANSGQWVDIDSMGNVTVDGQPIAEPYLSSKAYGETNISLPYQVPEGRVFVMGDNRAVSIDSRNSSVGCVSSEQVVGKIAFCVWPLNHLGAVA